MKIYYMNGAGNDFMVIDARGKDYDFETLSVELCKLTGADGFMAIDYSDCADFRLHFYNLKIVKVLKKLLPQCLRQYHLFHLKRLYFRNFHNYQ